MVAVLGQVWTVTPREVGLEPVGRRRVALISHKLEILVVCNRTHSDLIGLEVSDALHVLLDRLHHVIVEPQATLQDGVNQIDLTALDAQLQALDAEIGNLEALVAGGDLPDAPGAPPGGVPPPDDGGEGDDGNILPGDRRMLGGYVIPSKKRKSQSRRSQSRRSTTRRSASKGGKKTTKKNKKHKKH